MTLKIFQKGFNFSQDGPGNRLVYHLQGCNFRCPWCSNPESMAKDGCVMQSSGTKSEISCKEYTVDEIVDEAVRSRMMFFEGGGVTFTGGEPLLQFNALKEVLLRLKAENINTAIETNASLTCFSEIFELVDVIMMDFKHYDDEKHKEVIGTSNKEVKRNLKKASLSGCTVNVRIPLIGGFNASEDDAEKFADYFEKLNNDGITYEFLRYHEYGKEKWKKCGMEYLLTEEAFVEIEAYQRFKEIFQARGLRVIKT